MMQPGGGNCIWRLAELIFKHHLSKTAGLQLVKFWLVFPLLQNDLWNLLVLSDNFTKERPSYIPVKDLVTAKVEKELN